MQKLTDEQKAEQAIIAARDKSFNERFNKAFKEQFEFNHDAKKITPAKSNITGWSQLQRHREASMKFGSALLNTNENISFPGSNGPTVGTSPKDSKGNYLPDGNYSLQNGTNFQVTNGIISSVADVTAQKKAAEVKLAKAQVNVKYETFKQIYGDLFTLTVDQFEKLSDAQVDGIHTRLAPLALARKNGLDFKPAPSVKLSLLDQILAERGWQVQSKPKS